jgi:hypothetical protein
MSVSTRDGPKMRQDKSDSIGGYHAPDAGYLRSLVLRMQSEAHMWGEGRQECLC